MIRNSSLIIDNNLEEVLGLYVLLKLVLSHNLLTLAQGNVVEVLLVRIVTKLLTKSLHILQRVNTWGQDEEHWGGRADAATGHASGREAVSLQDKCVLSR